MIARQWRGWTTPGNAAAYESIVSTDALPSIAARDIAGSHGAYLRRRDLGNEVEFARITRGRGDPEITCGRSEFCAKPIRKEFTVIAVTLARSGPPEVLHAVDLPDPVAAPGQVVIDVRWASVTFVDTQIRGGRPPNPAMLPELPAILGTGVAGIVSAIGEGVDTRWAGRRVASMTGGRGGYAQRVAVPAELLIPVPEGLELRVAAALLADGRTALGVIRISRLTPGDVVLVEAAAGGVGTCLLQLARSAGAIVIAGVGSEEKLQVAEQLGADLVVNYSRGGWAQAVRNQFDGIDVVFDGVGGDVGETAVGLLRRGGRLCRYGMASGRFTRVPSRRPDVEVLEIARLAPAEWQALSVTALRRAAAGELRATIGQEFPLDRAADAHAAIEARSTTGKTLLRVADVPRPLAG